jgi:serine protease DegQ
MRKSPLYSRSPRTSPEEADATPAAAPPRRHLRAKLVALRTPLLLGTGILAALAIALFAALRAPPRALTQHDIDAAVLHTLDNNPLPSMASKAYAAVSPSVVNVRGLRHATDADKSTQPAPASPAKPRAHAKAEAHPQGAQAGRNAHSDDGDDPAALYRVGIGTGVVIVANGLILTNLHVIEDSDAIVVTFADGSESPADVVNTDPANDLAVLRARIVPDDLPAATLRSTADLAIGDQVAAIGFPFGIGPSESAGIVSGLRREYHSPEGNKTLTNLIQFDAAANPGNSGGPLVTADGEVVGIVTGIFNPTDQRVFIGIGFAVPIENAAAAVGLSPF